MNYWLVKSEPNAYSWDDLCKGGDVIWDGIRNYQARNFLKVMKKGDQAFYYHSGKDREIVGIAEIIEEAYPDPKDKEEKGWVNVKIKATQKLNQPVSLDQIKQEDMLSEMILLKQSRLSVMPVAKNEFNHILKLGS